MPGTLKVFEDPSRRRWRASLAVFRVLMLAAVALVAVFLLELVLDPPLPALDRHEHRARHALQAQPSHAIAAGLPAPAPTPLLASHARRRAGAGLQSLPRRGPQLVLGFLVQSDASSLASFEEHAAAIDVVVPDWLTLTGPGPAVRTSVEPRTRAALRRRGLTVLPRVGNLAGDTWRGADFAALIRSDADRRAAARNLAQAAVDLDVDGLNLDFESLAPEDNVPLLEFFELAAAALHERGRLLTVDVPANDPTYDLEAIGQLADGVVLMAYDEHYPGGEAGPVASESWFEDSVDDLAHAVPPEKLIVALGNYAYDWTAGVKPARVLTYGELMALADDLDAEPEMTGEARNMRFTYRDEQNREHEVWFLDQFTAWNEAVLARRRHVAGLGLWRLGSEAPSTWGVLSGAVAAPQELAVAPALATVAATSEGELLRIKSRPQPGPMDLTFDGELIDFAHYLDTPTGYALERVGSEMPAKSLVLTFDDGPDPRWTPQILDALERLDVPAAFFVVGEQAVRHPELVRQEAERGFLVGNHTYFHPDLGEVSPGRLRAELNSTQRLIESITQRRTLLFRAPYDTDSAPVGSRALRALQGASELGYVVAGANIDSDDWACPGVDAIVRTVERLAADPDNHVIVLHDAGGDRAQTIAALERFVPELRAQGYRFVGLGEASGLPRDLLNAPLTRGERWMVMATSLLTALLRRGWTVIVVLFALTTALSVLRIVLLGSLVAGRRHGGESATGGGGAALPFVSVVVPAFNEEAVIAKTLHSVLAGTHRDLEVVVVDDGSSDRTSAIVAAIAAADPRVRLVRVPNGGKAAALNRGFRAACAEIVVTIDADTILAADTVARLVRPFEDPGVDAVCGNVEVGNVHNALTAFQALEYVTTQNLDRRAFDRLNCITVVPGATGAWRRRRVLEIGGYQLDTLTEDADITLRLLRAGGRVLYEPEARSRTEAPETLGALARQRFRWSYGTFQCLWKHRSAMFRGALGWIGLPNLFLFQILFPILSPIGDLVFVLSLLRGDFRAVLAGYLLFLAMDLAGSLLAFRLERRSLRLVGLVLVQRFFYRQFMYVVTFRSLVASLRGHRHGWNKLQRQGSVPQQTQLA